MSKQEAVSFDAHQVVHQEGFAFICTIIYQELHQFLGESLTNNGCGLYCGAILFRQTIHS